jgi:hypothetical protein
MPRIAWTVILFVHPDATGMTGACHYTQPSVEMGWL